MLVLPGITYYSCVSTDCLLQLYRGRITFMWPVLLLYWGRDSRCKMKKSAKGYRLDHGAKFHGSSIAFADDFPLNLSKLTIC